MLRKVPGEQLEKYSSAITLSDMEIFIFPELLYSLVLANIMSPKIWAWREDPWFAKLDKLSPYRRILRLKQYIIDHYEFNLDLDTWGLTDQQTELARFSPFMDPAAITRSNALFGYEGDKYYFDMDIRRHFGLDKYTSDVIPYWKTETVEAMDAFRHKPGYRAGAGECVSLSTLYAAAMFIVCGIPLEDIFLLASPLHSQNFVFAGDGVITNNRRLVTRNMWFNGTELTAKAQRALRHEQITIVSHCTGHVHCVHPEASMAPEAYQRLQTGLRAFLSTDVTMEILANFLREQPVRQACFQLRHFRHGHPLYIEAEKAFSYEHGSPYKVSDATREKLLADIDEDEFYTSPIGSRVVFDQLEEEFGKRSFDPSNDAHMQELFSSIQCTCFQTRTAIGDLLSFARLHPRFPDMDAPKTFVPSAPVRLKPGMTREEIISVLETARSENPSVDLAFHALRDLSRVDWAPFLKAAMERNPVSIKGAATMDDAAVFSHLRGMPDESIYDGARAAQPDEVWNYGRGDGFEKAIAAANILKPRHPGKPMHLRCGSGHVELHAAGQTERWTTTKGLSGTADL